MKFIKTPHWTDLPNQQGLLFFAQILNEALFDYTLDTYKPQALNIRTLCIEALQTIDNIKSGLIKKQNINSIIEELLWSLNGDFVAKELIGNRLNEIVEKINSTKTNEKKLKDVILLLYHFFDNKKYLNKLQENLIGLVPANKEKERIYKATRSFITELISYGYTTGYIYSVTNRLFFNFSEKVSFNDPKPFFDIFNYEKKKFTVIYKVSNLFKEFKSIEANLKLKITDTFEAEGLSKEEQSFIDKKDKNEVFVLFEEVEALDDNIARLKTEIPLYKIGNLFSFYHHRDIPKISEFALIINNTDKYSILREKSIKSIVKKADIKPSIAAEKVKNLFATLDLPTNTIYRISRAIDLHSIALTTEEIENKLLNLWTAIETLIPKEVDSGNDRIVQIVNALLPFQVHNYLQDLIQQAGNDFFHFNKWKSKKFVASATLKSYDNDFISLVALMMTSENEPIRKQVYALLENYPLLRWRLFYLNKSLSCGKEINKLLENHKQKVEWQIRRIYRVRNLIVHSGKKPMYSNILVENLHNYFDDFLNYIIDNAISEKRIKTINEAILNCEIDCNILQTNISAISDAPITLENFKRVL